MVSPPWPQSWDFILGMGGGGVEFCSPWHEGKKLCERGWRQPGSNGTIYRVKMHSRSKRTWQMNGKQKYQRGFEAVIAT